MNPNTKETLYKDGIEVATHADIDDAAQTVKFVKAPEKEPPVYHTGGSSVLWRIFRQKRPAVCQRAAFFVI